jgi:hypothetical protein
MIIIYTGKSNPGTQEDPFKFTFEAPFGLKSEDALQYEGALQTDREFNILLGPQ